MKIPDNCTKITSRAQAVFHLNNGAILGLPVSWNRNLYVKKVEEDLFDVVVIPLFGKAVSYEGPQKSVLELVDGNTFFVLKGAQLKSVKPRFTDKVVNYINNIFYKNG